MSVGYGYHQSPPDANGVVRIRTDVQLRLSIAPKERLQKTLQEEFGALKFPGLYLLLDADSRRAYIGETGDLTGRLRQHLARAPKELARWASAALIGDGRPTLHSILNDSSIRQYLERGLIEPLRRGAYEVVNKIAQLPELNYAQKAVAEPLALELTDALAKYGIAGAVPPAPAREEITLEEAKTRLERKGVSVSELGAYEGTIDGKKAYLRPGSPKPRGWQITLRNAFRESVRDLESYLLVSRGRGLLIPFSTLREFLGGR